MWNGVWAKSVVDANMTIYGNMFQETQKRFSVAHMNSDTLNILLVQLETRHLPPARGFVRAIPLPSGNLTYLWKDPPCLMGTIHYFYGHFL